MNSTFPLKTASVGAALGLLLFSTLVSISFQQVDKTTEPGSAGRDVTLAALRKIQQSAIFPEDDRDFFRRVAYVETRYGTDNAEDGKYGGIWNISEFHFNQTKNTNMYPNLTTLYERIEQHFGIAWNNVTWEDLLKPLYSALAARLLISNVPAEIPGTIEQQALFWNSYYNPEGDREKFIIDVREMEKEPVCDGLMDIAIVLDGSASIDSFDFQFARGFVAHLIDTFPIDSVRAGFVVYSDEPDVVFPVENDLSKEEMKGLVLNVTHPQALTYTNAAMLAAVELLNNATERPGVPKILSVFTDGASTDGISSGPDMAREFNITPVAVGIGGSVNNDELLQIALNDTKNLFTLVGFAELEEFYYRLTSRTCEIPVDPSLNVTINDTLSQNQVRFFKWALPVDGIAVSVQVSLGKAILYYSYFYENPNSAWNDGMVEVEIESLVVIRSSLSGQGRTSKGGVRQDVSEVVYISIEGVDVSNSYSIEAVDGSLVPPEVTDEPTTVTEGETPSPTTTTGGETPSPTTVTGGETPSPTTVTGGETPSPTTVTGGETPSPTTVTGGETPSPTTVTGGETPSPTTVTGGETPSTTVTEGDTPSPTTASNEQSSSTENSANTNEMSTIFLLMLSFVVIRNI